MSFEWQCVKCGKIYPQDCEGTVHGGFYPFQPYVTIKCQCGGDLKICPTLRATDAEDSAPSQAVSNAETLSNSDGSAVTARRS